MKEDFSSLIEQFVDSRISFDEAYKKIQVILNEFNNYLDFLAKNNCEGCKNNIANQEGHYDGCLKPITE